MLDKVWEWVTGAANTVNKYSDLAKTGVAALSTYASYKDQKRKNELQEAAYDDYMKAAAAAGQEAEAAIALNLTPMTISGTPTTKAQVTDYTAATGLKHGGISSLRKRYAQGPGETEVLEMDEEVITPDYLMKEEGVNIGEQVFYNTGRGDRANAFMIWDQMSAPDKSIFDFDFEIFFNDGGWRDMIKGEVPMPQGETQMASNAENDAILEKLFEEYLELGLSPADAAKKAREEFDNMGQVPVDQQGIMQAAKGGRIGYAKGPDEFEVEQMDEEIVTPFDLKNEEGVPIGPMAGPDWYIKRIEHLEFLGYSYEEAGEIAFDDDKYFSIVGMGSAIPRGEDPEQPPIYLPKPGEEPQGIQMAAQGGIMSNKRGLVDGPGGYAGETMGPLNNEIEGFNKQMVDEYLQGNYPEFKNERVSDYYNRPNFTDVEAVIKIKEMGGSNDDVRRILGNENITDEWIEKYVTWSNEDRPPPMQINMKKGGRIGYAMGPGPVMNNTEGGIMDLGGMEKDYRFNGGFVPIGEYEKKDDVPARLSKNEFVFTADAVRAAGGGSINKGAKRMYETMKNLEARPEAKRMTA